MGELMKPADITIACHDASINTSHVVVTAFERTQRIPIKYVPEVLDWLEKVWEVTQDDSAPPVKVKNISNGQKFGMMQCAELCEYRPRYGYVGIVGWPIGGSYNERAKPLFNWLVDCENWLYQEGLLK